MHKYLISILLTIFLIVSCTPASTTQPPPATATQTIIPSQTPPPTQTSIPTATPYPPLQTDGPYLLFTYDNKNFTIMDADGGGRKQFKLPNDGYIGWDLSEFVSSDGKWLTYFTGSTKEPFDLALNLFDLENETSFPITNLLAHNFPQNLEASINILKFEDCGDNNTECKASAFTLGLLGGIESHKWSPDGLYLAFAAQIDGPSSDIYIFSIEDKTTIRLTNEPDNIYRIIWSPEGHKILYDTSTDGGGYTTSTIWRLADFTIKNPQNPKVLSEKKPWRTLGWFNEDLYFISTAVDSPSYIDTGYIDVNSKQMRVIWPHIAETMVFDPRNNRIVLSSFLLEPNAPETLQGTYLLYLDGTSTKISDEIFYLYQEQISFDSYLAMAAGNELVGISADGSITKYNQAIFYQNAPRVSPDKRWLILSGDNITNLFSKNIQLVGSWNIDASEVIWRTDSTGVFMYDRDELFYLSLPDGGSTSVDVCISKSCRQIFHVWLP